MLAPPRRVTVIFGKQGPFRMVGPRAPASHREMRPLHAEATRHDLLKRAEARALILGTLSQSRVEPSLETLLVLGGVPAR